MKFTKILYLIMLIFSSTISWGQAPYNDDCSGAIPVPIMDNDAPIYLFGTTVNATTSVDEGTVLGSSAVWEAVTLSGACNHNLTYSFCGTPAGNQAGVFIVYTTCPFTFYTYVTNYEATSCGDGNYTLTINDLPSGTYYLPVLAGGNTPGDYVMTVSSTNSDIIAPVFNGSLGAVDQENLVNNTYMANFAQTDLAQSFTPTESTICGASVETFGTEIGDITISLYTGLPNAGGILLTSGTESAVAAPAWANVSWPSVPVTQGLTYYLVLTSNNPSMGLGGDTGNNYPGGILYANPGYGPIAGFDYTFRTYTCNNEIAEVIEACEVSSLPIPTATDNCSGTIDGTTTTTFPIVSSTTVVWTFTDGSGNTSIKNQNVIIEDLEAPVPDVTDLPFIQSTCSVDFIIEPTANDNCLGTVFGLPNVSFPITENTTIEWYYFDNNGNYTSQFQEVYILPVDASTSVNGATISASNTNIGVTYQWVDCDNAFIPINNETSSTYTAIANGNYAVLVTEGSCTEMSECVAMDLTEVSEVNSDLFKVYPIPASNVLFIETIKQGSIEIHDLSGKLVSRANVTQGKNEIFVSNLSSGTYTVRLTTETAVKTVRLVINRQ